MEWKVAPTYENWEIEEVDENAHKGHIVTKCWKCGGTGMYAWFGPCFACGGSGYQAKWVKIYTPDEYNKYVATQERAKAKRVEKAIAKQNDLLENSDSNKAALLEKWGFDAENPKVYVVLGNNTYAIKDELKTRGARFNQVLGWHFTKPTEVPEGYSLLAIDFDAVYEWFPLVKKIDLKETAKQAVEEAKNAAMPESKSQFVGEVKERLRGLKVTLTGARAVNSAYGTSIMFTFRQEENELVWFTSCPPDEKDAVVGHQYSLTGTVKDHKIYNGIKQTYLNRCLLKEI